MKSKKYNIFLTAAVLLSAVFFFINGCSVQRTADQSASVSTDNQISSDTLTRASDRNRNTIRIIKNGLVLNPGADMYMTLQTVIHHKVYSQVQNLRICRQTGDVLSAMKVKTSL